MITVPAFIDDAGHFALDNQRAFRDLVQRAKKLHGHDVIVTVKLKPRQQGSQQLRYLNGVVIPDIAAACGYTDPEDYASVREGILWRFLRIADGPFGEPRRKSTAKDAMSQQEMTELIDRIMAYAETSIPGCRIRRPEEVNLDDVYVPEVAA